MNPDELRRRVESINVAARNGRRAPHKPLLLLLALRRMLQGRPRLATYTEIKEELRPLLKQFNGQVATQHPEQPFTFLENDDLWEISPPDLPQTNWGIASAVLTRAGAEGGFPEDVYNLLKSDPSLVNQIIAILLAKHFAPSLYGDILEAVGLANFDSTILSRSRKRDPQFRDDVLRAYRRNCAICGYDIRIGNKLFGLEAAHIRWHSHGGPDEISNGLALCTFHHKAFDVGAIGLELADIGLRLLLSRSVDGQSETLQQLKQFHRHPIRSPKNPKFTPDLAHVEWHYEQVFRKPPMDPSS